MFGINKKIIDLSEPLLTNEALNGMNDEMYAPLNDEGRCIKNIRTIDFHGIYFLWIIIAIFIVITEKCQ